MYRSVQTNIKYSTNNDIKPNIISLSDDAYKTFIEIFNMISEKQNDENEPEMFKSMLSKIKTYIPRLALIIHFIKSFYNNKDINEEISDVTMFHAWELSQYFISQFKRIKIDSLQNKELFEIKTGKKQLNTIENFKTIFKQIDKENVNKTALAKQFGVSRKTIINWIKAFENENSK